MNPYRMAPPPGAWDSKLSPLLVRLGRRVRNRLRVKNQQLRDVHVRGVENIAGPHKEGCGCLLYTSPSPRDRTRSRMPSSA